MKDINGATIEIIVPTIKTIKAAVETGIHTKLESIVTGDYLLKK